MVRVSRADGPGSGKAGTKDIGKIRTKRRKRKDLEKLRRNVLETKRNARASQKKKRKTTLEKVLNNFADKRQETEDICQDGAGKKDKKKKSRTICNRLLPETIFGIYRNGTKGHKISRDNINEARLRGDVLKLLNGDETNPKFSCNKDKELAENGKASKALSSDESDYAGSIGGRLSRTKTPISPILGKTKRLKRINGEKKKINSIEEDEVAAEKNEQQQFLQRENNCKRRLFEPNEDQTDSHRLGNGADSSDSVMGEIRFSPPPPGNARDVSPPEDWFRKKKHVESKEIESRIKRKKKLMPIEATTDANFWGWSPTIYYERLCAMVSAENFENNRSEQPSSSDPLVKIRSTLRECWRNACRDRRRGRKTVIAKGNECREQTLSKVGVRLKDSSFPSSGEIQACITDSEVDQESLDSSVIKVGSWRPKHLARNSNPKNSSVVPKTNEIFESNIHTRNSQLSDSTSASINEQNNHREKSKMTIDETIHSVKLFLEELRENNPLNGKANIFEEKDVPRVSGQEQHFPDNSTENPPRDFTFDMNQRNLVRRNTKHVPTILQRSNRRCGVLEDVGGKHQLLPPNNCLVNGPDNYSAVATRMFANGNERREQTLLKVGVRLKDSSFPCSEEIQACITNSEVDQEFLDSSVIEVGSCCPKHLGRISNPKNSSVVPKTNEIFASNIHTRNSQLSDSTSAPINEQNNHCEKSKMTIDETIHSVKLFLEKLRENNPLNGNANIFDEKDAPARVSGQEQHSLDNSPDKPPRDLTFDMNQRNLVRRNTKHVPKILRRSNSRCGVLEDVGGKHQLLPPNNCLVNGPKRSTRTIAALPPCSQSKTNDSDYLQTPSIVNQLSVINKTKSDILKTKLNFMRAKYRPDPRSLSSDYQELGNSQKKSANSRKKSVSQFFANGDQRGWYPTDFAVNSQDPTLGNRREEDRKSQGVNFGTHDDFTEASISQIENSSPEDFYNLHSSNRHENPGYHMQRKLSFEFPCPEIPKNFDARQREIFTNERANPPQRLSREDSEETFIIPRYLAEDSKTSTRGSRVSGLVAASQCGNEIQFVREAYVEHSPIPAETKDEIKNRSFKPLPSYHANSLSVNRLAMNEAAGCAQRYREVALRPRIRKPVMVFRPIQETRQQQEICDSRYRLTENGEGTINDAVRNFRVLTFDDNNINRSTSEHRPPSEVYDLRYHSHHHQQQQQQQKSLLQPHCHQQLIHNRHNQDFHNQPTKYLAYDGSDGRNPRRIPIFMNSDDNQAANRSKLFNASATPENTDITCLSCYDCKNPRFHATRVHCYGQQQQQQPEMGPRRTSEVTLMLPCSASLCQQAATNNPETRVLPPPHGKASIKDIPRVVYSMTAGETIGPVEMTYQLEPPLYAQSRYDNEKLSKRVQLPDGTVGILVTENDSIDNSECLDSNAGAASRFKRIGMGNLNERNCSG